MLSNLLVYGVILVCISIYLFTLFFKLKGKKEEDKKEFPAPLKRKRRTSREAREDIKEYYLNYMSKNEKKPSIRRIINEIGTGQTTVSKYLPEIKREIKIEQLIFDKILDIKNNKLKKPTAFRVRKACDPLMTKEEVEKYFDSVLSTVREFEGTKE